MYTSFKGYPSTFKSYRYIRFDTAPGRRLPRRKVLTGPAILEKRLKRVPNKHRIERRQIGERKVVFLPEQVWRDLSGNVLQRTPATYRTLPLLQEILLPPAA